MLISRMRPVARAESLSRAHRPWASDTQPAEAEPRGHLGTASSHPGIILSRPAVPAASPQAPAQGWRTDPASRQLPGVNLSPPVLGEEASQWSAMAPSPVESGLCAEGLLSVPLERQGWAPRRVGVAECLTPTQTPDTEQML